MPILGVDTGGVLLEQIVVIPPCCLLQKVDGLRIVQVLFLIAALLMPADAGQPLVHAQFVGVKCTVVHFQTACCDIIQIDTANTADGIREILLHHAVADAQRLENLRALIGLDGGDPHLGGDLDDTGNHGIDVRLACLRVVLIHQTAVDHIIQRIQCQIRIDCACTETTEGCEVVYFARLCGFHDDGNCGVFSGSYQIGFQCCNCQQRRNCNVILIHATVSQNQNGGAVCVCLFCLMIQGFNGIMQRNILGIEHGDICGLQSLDVHTANLHQI